MEMNVKMLVLNNFALFYYMEHVLYKLELNQKFSNVNFRITKL
jgi:hypothetical protein